MIDLHSHLLFGVDDGAGDEIATHRMLERYAEQGVSVVAATSHSAVSAADYRRVFAEVVQMASPFGIQLVPGREYSLADAEEQRDDLQFLGSGKFLMMDLGGFSVNSALCNQLDDFASLLLFAHPERIWEQDAVTNARFWQEHRKCFFQLNSGSFLGRYGKGAEKAAWDLLNGGFCSVIASDAHRSRGIEFDACRKLLLSYYEPEIVELLFEANPHRILAGEFPLRVFPSCSRSSRIRHFFHSIFKPFH